MIVGVPKEIKLQEHRIGLTPDSVKTLVSEGHEVLVENKMKDQNKYFGRNKYLSSVIFEDYKHNVGKIINVKIEKSNKKTLFGKVDKPKNMKAA